MLTDHHWFAVFVWAAFALFIVPLVTLWVLSILFMSCDYVRHLVRSHHLKHRRIPHRPSSRFDGARKP